MGKKPRINTGWITNKTDAVEIDGPFEDNIHCCCGVIEIGNFDEFEQEWIEALEDAWLEEAKLRGVKYRFGQHPVQDFLDKLSEKNRNKLLQYALETCIKAIFDGYGQRKMFLSTTIERQTIAAEALTNTGFKEVGKKLGAYGNVITVWLKQ